jgi:hypothetical protein
MRTVDAPGVTEVSADHYPLQAWWDLTTQLIRQMDREGLAALESGILEAKRAGESLAHDDDTLYLIRRRRQQLRD